MAGGKRNGSGRKKVTISLEEVEKLAAIQCTDVEIAAFFGVSVRTIERRKSQAAFAEAIERGKAKGRVSLRRYLFALAAKGIPAAAIFLSKNLLGYKDYFANELSGPNGGADPEWVRRQNTRHSVMKNSNSSALCLVKPNVRVKVERELATRSLLRVRAPGAGTFSNPRRCSSRFSYRCYRRASRGRFLRPDSQLDH